MKMTEETNAIFMSDIHMALATPQLKRHPTTFCFCPLYSQHGVPCGVNIYI